MKWTSLMILCCFLATSAFAAKSNHGTWTCTTNASSPSSNSSAAKADDQMKNKKTSAKAAFDFAYSHCRDCTSITCEMSK